MHLKTNIVENMDKRQSKKHMCGRSEGIKLNLRSKWDNRCCRERHHEDPPLQVGLVIPSILIITITMIIVIFLIIAVILIILIPMMIRREAIADMVPVDICINLLVCVAWQTARQPKGAPIKVVRIPTMWWVDSQPLTGFLPTMIRFLTSSQKSNHGGSIFNP